MQVREPEFDVEITLADLEAIRGAIRRWGKPADVAAKFDGARLYDHFSRWADFVGADWAEWDQSEYNHDVGCRAWIQLAIEYSSSETAARLQAAVAPIDARFMGRMRRARRTDEPTPVLRAHPYFWETYTLHPDLAAANWEPLAGGVSWKEDPLVSFRKSRASLEADLGPPQARDRDSNGMGPYDAWALRFACGLELLLLAFHVDSKLNRIPPDQETWVEIQSNETDFAHITAHLPFEVREVSPWLPDRRTSRPPHWTVMRQDDNGHRFEVATYGTRCEADIRIGHLETWPHKQMYWVVERAG